MAAVCILDEFEVHKNEKFLKTAERLKPGLHEKLVRPQNLRVLDKKQFKRNDQVVLDFGDHQVGYVTLGLSSAGSHQGVPAYI